MSARAIQPHFFGGGFALQRATTRRTRNGKVAHILTYYTNGATNSVQQPWCYLDDWLAGKPVQLLGERDKWRDAPDGLPLCNRCGRAFHRERRDWVGTP